MRIISSCTGDYLSVRVPDGAVELEGRRTSRLFRCHIRMRECVGSFITTSGTSEFIAREGLTSRRPSSLRESGPEPRRGGRPGHSTHLTFRQRPVSAGQDDQVLGHSTHLTFRQRPVSTGQDDQVLGHSTHLTFRQRPVSAGQDDQVLGHSTHLTFRQRPVSAGQDDQVLGHSTHLTFRQRPVSAGQDDQVLGHSTHLTFRQWPVSAARTEG